MVQGLGGSMLLPIGRLAILRNVSSEQYIAALAFVSVAGRRARIFGPMLGGWLVQSVSWHWIFLINVPIGVLGLAAAALPAGRPRLAGAALRLAGLRAAVAVHGGLRSRWTHRAAGGGAAHALWERRAVRHQPAVGVALYIPMRAAAAPLFRLALFREPNFSVGLAGNLACRIGSGAVPFLLLLCFSSVTRRCTPA